MQTAISALRGDRATQDRNGDQNRNEAYNEAKKETVRNKQKETKIAKKSQGVPDLIETIRHQKWRPKRSSLRNTPSLKQKNKLQQKNILALDLKGKRKSKGKKKVSDSVK